MFIVMPAKIENDVKAVRVPSMSCVLFSTRQEAVKQAETLAQKHNKPYHVFHLVNEANHKRVVELNVF